MPWCPNCKTEYREGIETCADCGSHLVKSLNEEERAEDACSLLYGDEKQVRMIENHLKENGFSSVFAMRKKTITTDNPDMKQGKQYELFVSAEERDGAIKCAAEYMRSTTPKNEEEEKKQAQATVARIAGKGAGKEYKTAKERYSDMKSSGIMLLCFGVAGLAFMVLVILDIIPINFSGYNAIIAYSVLGIFFGALFVSGIMSLVGAKKMRTADDEEKKQLDALNEWCEQNLTKEIIENKIPGDAAEDEQIYFARYDYMKEALSKEFPDLKEDFLEYYTESIYGKYFE